MLRKILAGPLAATIMAALCPSVSLAQSKAAQIATALSAAPSAISAHATVMAAAKDGKLTTLREGTNGWTCMPGDPKSKYNSNNAMCLDATWMSFIGALMSGQKAPNVKQVGYSYMLSTNDWESNTDASAKAPTATNDWHHVGSHVMVVYPDARMLDGIPTHPSKAGAYVMWPGTPYAHVMLPVK
ncbi:MAG TPA: hypothetical protein VM053_03690 [Gemmatimonadaceae bacterium]|nr:hypothetical protein [Gemmatimonadaceae bacterium]